MKTTTEDQSLLTSSPTESLGMAFYRQSIANAQCQAALLLWLMDVRGERGLDLEEKQELVTAIVARSEWLRANPFPQGR